MTVTQRQSNTIVAGVMGLEAIGGMMDDIGSAYRIT